MSVTQDSQIRTLFTRNAGLVMTVPELAQLMNMSPNTLLGYIRDGRLPAVKLERGFRIVTEDAINFFESSYTAQGAPAGDAPAERAGDLDDQVADVPPVRHLRPTRPSTNLP